MTHDLVVPDGGTITLDDRVSGQLKEARHLRKISTLDDLVTHRILSSGEELTFLLEKASGVTKKALRDVEIYKTRRVVPGTNRPDLGRFSAMLAATAQTEQEQQPIERSKLNIFWNVIRKANPEALALDPLGLKRLRIDLVLIDWMFNNVTVGENAVLHVKGDDLPRIDCNALLIKRGARLVATGGALHIDARSLKGEQ